MIVHLLLQLDRVDSILDQVVLGRPRLADLLGPLHLCFFLLTCHWIQLHEFLGKMFGDFFVNLSDWGFDNFEAHLWELLGDLHELTLGDDDGLVM